MMSRAIHLCIPGPECRTAFGLPMHEMCILGTQDGAIGLIEGLKGIGFDRIRYAEADLSDYGSVYDSVRSLCSSYDDAHFYVNISSGNSVAVAAMVSAVQSFDSSLYYVKDGTTVVQESDSLDDIAWLRSKRRILETFLRFRLSPSFTNKELMGSLSNSALTYHTRELSRMGLIRKEGSSKNPVWVITKKGEQALKRL